MSLPLSASLQRWAYTHTDRAVKICYLLAALGFAGSLAIFHRPLILGVLIGFIVARGAVYGAEWLAESAFLENLRRAQFSKLIQPPGIGDARALQILRRVASNRGDEALASQCAAFVSFAIDAGKDQMTGVVRTFEDTWGIPPEAGGDTSLIANLLNRGVRFSMPENVDDRSEVEAFDELAWTELVRGSFWQRLRSAHPGENLFRLSLRLYAPQWQRLLSPLWVIFASGCLVVMWDDRISATVRGAFCYPVTVFLAATALWLAFILRPSAFNRSLIAGDTERCARWALESTEGKHFLVSALGSRQSDLRSKAVELLLWNDQLFNAGLTLPEGMRAFVRRESSGKH